MGQAEERESSQPGKKSPRRRQAEARGAAQRFRQIPPDQPDPTRKDRYRERQVRPAERNEPREFMPRPMEQNADSEEQSVVEEPKRLENEGILSLQHRIQAGPLLAGPQNECRGNGQK